MKPRVLSPYYVLFSIAALGCGGDSSAPLLPSPVRILPADAASPAALAVSADGQTVVGTSNPISIGYPFVGWRGTTPFSLPDAADAHFGAGYGVSDDGSTIVGIGTPLTATGALIGVALIWSASRGTQKVELPGEYSSAVLNDVSRDGIVAVGIQSPLHGTGPQAFRWSAGVVSFLPGLNVGEGAGATAISSDGRVTVGYSGSRAVRWTNDGPAIAITAEGESGDARDTSRDGSVIVGQRGATPDGPRLAFRWTASNGLVSLGTLPGFIQSVATATSDDGTVVVGNAFNQDFRPDSTEPFIWTPSTGLRPLRRTLIGRPYAAFRSLSNVSVRDISKDGKTVVGSSYDPTTETYHAFSVRLP